MTRQLRKNNRRSNLEVIQDLFAGRVKEKDLSEHQYQYLVMVRSAYGMLLEVKSRKYIVGALMRQFEISQESAYRIIRECGKIFGKVGKVDKEIYRHMTIEMAKSAYLKAQDAADVKEMINATKALIKAVGLDRDDVDLPDFEKLQPSLNLLVLPDGMEEKIEQLLTGGAVDLNRFDSEEIAYEEVDENADQAENTGNS